METRDRMLMSSRAFWAPINDTMCYQDVVCEDECCHDLEFGIPYCCSRYAGFIYLGLMIGGGVIIAILVIACYVCMRRTERELEAAAKLEAAKAVNSACSTNSLDTSLTDQNDLTNQSTQHPDANPLPPAYQDVMRTFTRCQSCDIPMTTAAQSVEIMNALVRQYSEGSQAPLRGLPVLVDIQELIARHRREHGGHRQGAETGLPPVNSQNLLQNKLPTYEECTSRNMEVACGHPECSRESERDSGGGGKLTCNVLSTLSSSFDYGGHGRTRRDVEHINKTLGESNVYFENVRETFLNAIREDSVINRISCALIREGSEGEGREGIIGNTARREWAEEEEEPRVIGNRRKWVQEEGPPVMGNRDRNEWVPNHENRVTTDGREWVQDDEQLVTVTREYVQGTEPRVILDTGRREYVQGREPRVILDTGRREYVQGTEPRVILDTGRREYVQGTEPRVILDTHVSGPVQEEEPRVVVDTEIRECAEETELHVIESTEIRDTAQEAESKEVNVKAETFMCAGGNGQICGSINIEAKDLARSIEAGIEMANREVEVGCLINKETYVTENVGTGNRKTEKEIVGVKGAENSEGGICAKYIQIGTGIENAETSQEIEDCRMIEYVEQVNKADTVERGETTETMEHISDLEKRECVAGRQTGVAVESTEMQQDTEDCEMLVSADIMECTSDIEVKEPVWILKTKREIGGIGEEIVPTIREENQNTVTREKIEDVTIREGITDTEKREGIGDTKTIKEHGGVDIDTRQRFVSVDTIDKAKDRKPINTTARQQTGGQMIEKEIKGKVISDTIQNNDLIKCTEGTEVEEQKSTAGTTSRERITDKEKREDVSKI